MYFYNTVVMLPYQFASQSPYNFFTEYSVTTNIKQYSMASVYAVIPFTDYSSNCINVSSFKTITD